ncbi:hypothetical protein AAVH_23172 [Aphelenchoides avenae]|nr:hypothetical protein AAVH_23172 [Aphelenchus avenae]
MSSTYSATHRAFLRDILGRILDGKGLPPQTLMQAYTSAFNWIDSTPRRPGDDSPARVEAYNFDRDFPLACAEAYDFIRDSLSVHIHTKINEAEARDVPKLAPTAGTLKMIDAVCRYLHRKHVRKQGLEEIAAFAVRTFREAAVERILSDGCSHQLFSDWLQGAIEGVRQGNEPSDDEKSYGRRLLEIFEACPDDCATRISTPFIRNAVALYHEKAKTLVSDGAFDARKAEVLEMETRRAEVYLHEPHRSDYVATIAELFGLADEKFQRP